MNAKSVLSAALAAAGVAAVAALFYFLARGAVEKDPNRPASSPRPETTAVYRAGYSRRLLEKNGTCVAAEVTRTNPYRVTECTALGKGWPCTRDAGECTDGYRAFLDRADADAVPRTLGEINEWQHDIFKRGYAPEALNAGALRRRLIAALNIEFLVDGLDERPLTVTTVAATRSGDGETRELIFSDPFVGDFRALLVAPVPARRKSPAIIALHGHFDAPETFFDQFFGKRLVAEGIAVLVLSSRALGGAPHEPETVLRFLHRGFHVLGLHVYETLLAHKYLSFLSLLPNGPVDAEAIGLLGHSSGSTTANIALRLLRGKIRAYAGDQITEYLGVYPVSAANENSVFVTQAPPLFPYSRAVNDFSTAGADVLMLPYGFRDGDLSYENEVVSFFASKLTGR